VLGSEKQQYNVWNHALLLVRRKHGDIGEDNLNTPENGANKIKEFIRDVLGWSTMMRICTCVEELPLSYPALTGRIQAHPG
jgi:hypothetical protein